MARELAIDHEQLAQRHAADASKWRREWRSLVRKYKNGDWVEFTTQHSPRIYRGIIHDVRCDDSCTKIQYEVHLTRADGEVNRQRRPEFVPEDAILRKLQPTT